MDGPQSHSSWFFLGSNPDGTGSANQRKGIISDDVGWSVHFQFDCVVRKRLNGAEFIGDAQNYSSAVRTISNQLSVVGKKHELCIHPSSRKTFRDHLLSLDVALDAEVSPFMKQLAHLKDEGCVAKMRKLLPVRIEFRD